MGRALSPVEQALAQWRAFVAARAAWARLAAALRRPAAPARLRLPRPTGRVDVEDLTVLAPSTSRPVVRRVSVSLAPGEALAVVGPTGSGKSSLARALVGAWKTTGGSIRFDGNDLAHFNPDDLGAALGYLPQDVELFAGTVARNIARFGPQDDAGVLAAAMAASAHGMIQRLPDGYETQVGEDGVGLSGGQRQRVGLARALYGEPALVVLDEPNANLDGEGDLALIEAIRGLKRRGCSVVLVTHKPGLLAVVDRILVMHEGAAAREGPRDLLLPLILGPNVEAAARTMQAAKPAAPAPSPAASARA
jgi:ABC-type protease/lipase transport system fused ATPase/permease subunit